MLTGLIRQLSHTHLQVIYWLINRQILIALWCGNSLPRDDKPGGAVTLSPILPRNKLVLDWRALPHPRVHPLICFHEILLSRRRSVHCTWLGRNQLLWRWCVIFQFSYFGVWRDERPKWIRDVFVVILNNTTKLCLICNLFLVSSSRASNWPLWFECFSLP